MKRMITLLLIFLPISAFADLQVHFLDVGQGDCTIILCDGESMVIDGGPASSSQFVYSYEKNTLELKHMDVMISTHPHLDHVYGLSSVLNAVPVDLIAYEKTGQYHPVAGSLWKFPLLGCGVVGLLTDNDIGVCEVTSRFTSDLSEI